MFLRQQLVVLSRVVPTDRWLRAACLRPALLGQRGGFSQGRGHACSSQSEWAPRSRERSTHLALSGEQKPDSSLGTWGLPDPTGELPQQSATSWRRWPMAFWLKLRLLRLLSMANASFSWTRAGVAAPRPRAARVPDICRCARAMHRRSGPAAVFFESAPIGQTVPLADTLRSCVRQRRPFARIGGTPWSPGQSLCAC